MYYHFKHRHTHKYFCDYRFLYAIGSHCSIFVFTALIIESELYFWKGKAILSHCYQNPTTSHSRKTNINNFLPNSLRTLLIELVFQKHVLRLIIVKLITFRSRA